MRRGKGFRPRRKAFRGKKLHLAKLLCSSQGRGIEKLSPKLGSQHIRASTTLTIQSGEKRNLLGAVGKEEIHSLLKKKTPKKKKKKKIQHRISWREKSKKKKGQGQSSLQESGLAPARNDGLGAGGVCIR